MWTRPNYSPGILLPLLINQPHTPGWSSNMCASALNKNSNNFEISQDNHPNKIIATTFESRNSGSCRYVHLHKSSTLVCARLHIPTYLDQVAGLLDKIALQYSFISIWYTSSSGHPVKLKYTPICDTVKNCLLIVHLFMSASKTTSLLCKTLVHLYTGALRIFGRIWLLHGRLDGWHIFETRDGHKRSSP